MRNQIFVDQKGQLMISKDALISHGIYTDNSYRKTKSIGNLSDTKIDGIRYVYVNKMTKQTRERVYDTFNELIKQYGSMIKDAEAAGEDTAQLAVDFTAETLHINEPFIRSAIETHMNTHYTAFTDCYLDLGLNSRSVKGYAKQCALVEWTNNFATKITESEPDAKRAELKMRSFRMNLLTALSKIELEVKIPLSEARFNKWFDDTLTALESGRKPQDIITIKRFKNKNASKITPEQRNIVTYWHINGTNMSVPTLYKKWIKYGKDNGWWTSEDGNFNPPTEARLYQILAPLKNANTLEKTDAITYRLNNIPSVSRDLPEKKNHVWVIDGTAHNENVDAKGKVRQHIYVIKVADVSTLKMVGASPLIGVKEPFYAVKEAILMGIRGTGYKPAIIQCDRGPAWKELERWCEEVEIKLYPALPGNARSKTIENMFYQFDNDITRFLKGYSGQNRTALTINSRSSERREIEGKQNARSASIVMDWLKTTGITIWNERIIETLERKLCGKSPNQLWDEKESFVPKLSYTQIAVLCGTLHERKLTINGLDIEHNTQPYTYFPPIDTPEQRAKANDIFTYIPLKADSANRLKIYILNPGEPAPVYTQQGDFLGLWNMKTNAAYIAETKQEKAVLSNYMSLQYRINETAKTINTEIKQAVERHPDYENIKALGNEMLTGKRVISRYDKSALLEEEATAKAQEPETLSVETLQSTHQQFKSLVDPDTGEIYQILIN